VNKMDFFTTGYGAYMRAYRAYAQVPPDAAPPLSEAESDVKGGVA
jgi:hypothetical protein